MMHAVAADSTHFAETFSRYAPCTEPDVPCIFHRSLGVLRALERRIILQRGRFVSDSCICTQSCDTLVDDKPTPVNTVKHVRHYN